MCSVCQEEYQNLHSNRIKLYGIVRVILPTFVNYTVHVTNTVNNETVTLRDVTPYCTIQTIKERYTTRTTITGDKQRYSYGERVLTDEETMVNLQSPTAVIELRVQLKLR